MTSFYLSNNKRSTCKNQMKDPCSFFMFYTLPAVN